MSLSSAAASSYSAKVHVHDSGCSCAARYTYQGPHNCDRDAASLPEPPARQFQVLANLTEQPRFSNCTQRHEVCRAMLSTSAASSDMT